MNDLVYENATIIGAIPRILNYEKRLSRMSYLERVRFCNKALGPDWIFRLIDIVGEETIRENRPSWLDHYRDDIYGQHLPLDPRAPETDEKLGEVVGAREFALYAGVGFDGYQLVLNTKRQIRFDDLSLSLGNLRFQPSDAGTLRKLIGNELSSDDYYEAYSAALRALFETYSLVDKELPFNEEAATRAALATLVFMCGGHTGCNSHVDKEEEQLTRRTVVVLCNYVTDICHGKAVLSTKETQHDIAA